jgi:L-amino acid N-acyltransferase YncA
LQSSIFPENKASIALHQKAGFRIIGYREKIAYMKTADKMGQWRDITLLERRSKNIGQ